MRKTLIALAVLLAILAAPGHAQTLWRNANQLALETGQANRYSLLNGPLGLKSPLWLGTAPTGTSTDAWLYMTGQPSGFDYAIYSGSTLPSYFAGGISFTQIAGASLELEGTTANAYETTLTVGDPTADRTVTFADASGTVMLTSLATNAADVANAVTGTSNGILFEGATANAFELTLSPADVTADRTITLPDAAGTVTLQEAMHTATIFEAGVTNVTAADDGAGTKPAIVIPITTSIATCTCNDATGCTASVAEPTPTSGYGRTLLIISIGTGNCEFADSAGVTELSGALTLGATDTLHLIYANSAWHQIATSNN